VLDQRHRTVLNSCDGRVRKEGKAAGTLSRSFFTQAPPSLFSGGPSASMCQVIFSDHFEVRYTIEADWARFVLYRAGANLKLCFRSSHRVMTAHSWSPIL
jgi:hypothetical protein